MNDINRTRKEDMALLPLLAQYTSPERIPMSFVYDGRKYNGLTAELSPKVKREFLDANMTRTTVSALIDNTVAITVEYTEYRDFPVSEWVAWFENISDNNSKILSDIKILDTVFEGENPRFTWGNGDTCNQDGYEFWTEQVGEKRTIHPIDMTACNGASPFMKYQFDSYGIRIGIGWPGRWQVESEKCEGGVHFTLGQMRCHMYLKSGEKIRTPRVNLLGYTDGDDHGRNLWRRWYFAHILPREHGNPLKPKLVLHTFMVDGKPEFTGATEANQISGIDDYINNGYKPDIWWLDAGWYYSKIEDGSDNWWSTVGDWECDTERFPNGLAPIGLECEKNGLDFLVWFESERVTENSKILAEHPEWILDAKENNPYNVKLLDLSNKDCCDYIIKKIGDFIEESHIKIYRQDFNCCPYFHWREADAEDRRGATENLYIQGYLRFWDALKERFPYLVIDSCASGGRRNDIETMRRSVPMHQTDSSYGNHPVQQAFSQTLYTWIPYFKGFTGSWERADGSYEGNGPWKAIPFGDEFVVLASFAPMMAFNFLTRRAQTEEEYAIAREYADLFHKVAPILCTADFYALTPYHKSRFKWTAWQFDEPEKEHGIIKVIRNNAAPDESLTVSPRLREGKYLFKNLRNGEEFIHEGGQITFTQPIRSVTLWEYSKI